jgi:ubiquinone/menaquinone biosynthesis C-methylase UbiE
MMVRELLDSRPGEFRITALDSSPAMVEECARRAGPAANVTVMAGDVMAMPFPDGSFDVVLAMGVLEYTDLPVALKEIHRVLRPGGRLLVTMLNPRSPYRLFEWYVHWPFLRHLVRLEQWLRLPPDRRHRVADSGIRAHSERAFRRALEECGLSVTDVAYYDVTFMLPPLDDYVRRWVGRYRRQCWERTVSRGWRRFFGSAYLVEAGPAPPGPI